MLKYMNFDVIDLSLAYIMLFTPVPNLRLTYVIS